MAGMGTGIGSPLVMRAKEARQRAQAADALGLTQTRTFAGGVQAAAPGPMYPPSSVQPVVAPDSNPDLNDRMYGAAEAFLMGLQTQLRGEQPTGAARPPTSSLPPSTIPPTMPGGIGGGQ